MARAYVVGALALAGFMTVSVASNFGTAVGQSSRQHGKSTDPASGRSRPKASAEWSADPERGWVRADERQGRRNTVDSPKKPKGSHTKHQRK